MNQINKKHSQASNFFTKLSKIWELIVDYYHLIKLVRFSILIVLVVLLFILIPQGKEALIVMMENAEESNFEQMNYFIFTTVLLALMSWYYARILYQFAFNKMIIKLDKYKKFKQHFPRWLGFFMIVFPAISIYFITENSGMFTLYMLAIAFLFLLFVYGRRKIFRLVKITDHKNTYVHFKDLPKHTKVILLGFIVINWVLLYLFSCYGHYISVTIGATAVVMLALATLVSVGSSVTFIGERKGIPLLLIVVIVAVLSSMIMDNHDIRFTDEKVTLISEKTSIENHFTKWYNKRKVKHLSGATIPVFFVSTEGGGIRAAYWTAIVLGRLQDVNPEFSKYLYAISGVSGGSLGASVFDALLSQSQHMDKNSSNDCIIDGTNNNNYYCRSKRILKQDFLSPAVANMMFPDFFQRFCFFCDFDDRAQALEESWQLAWDKEWQNLDVAKGVFNQPFQNIWTGDSEMKIPQLFLNSTVESVTRSV